MTKWTAISLVINGLAVLTALAAGAIAYRQYRATAMQESVKQTIEFLKLSYTAPIRPAQDHVWKVIAENQDTVRRMITDNIYQFDPLTRSKKYQEKIQAIVSENNLTGDVVYTFSFFDQLATCVNAEICDLKTTKAFFKSDFKTFADWFQPTVEGLLRANGQGYFDTEFAKLVSHLQ